MGLRFQLSFAEDYLEISGTRALHLVCTAEEPASARMLYSFDVSLYSTGKKYQHSWQKVQMPVGSTQVSIPFVPPLEWADDFVENTGDLAHADACGLFQATMTAHYTGYAGSVEFSHEYTGYAAQMPGGVPASLTPVVQEVSVQAVDGVVPQEWGVWVQGESVVRLTAKAAGIQGSRIVSWQFGSRQQQTEPTAELALTESGRVTIPVTVTDSRLHRATKDIFLEVLPYQPPSLAEISSFRCEPDGTPAENGTAFLPRYRMQASLLEGWNIPRVICRWKKVTEKDYGWPREPVAGEPMEAELEPETSYDVKYTVSDTFHSIDYFDYISSTVYLLHFLKGGTGIAVGKAAERGNLFDVGLDSVFRRNVTAGGDLTVQGRLKLNQTDVSAALQQLSAVHTAAVRCLPSLTDVTENTAVRCGHLVVSRIAGLLVNGNEPPYEGEAYPVAELPTGYFSPKMLPAVVASQNGKPCTGYVTAQGQVVVIPAQTGLQDTQVCTIGMTE